MFAEFAVETSPRSKSPGAVVVKFPLFGDALVPCAVAVASSEFVSATPEYSRMANRNVLGVEDAERSAICSFVELDRFVVGVQSGIRDREHLTSLTCADHYGNPVPCSVSGDEGKRGGGCRPSILAGVLNQRDPLRVRE